MQSKKALQSKRAKGYDTDILFQKIGLNLIQDFRKLVTNPKALSEPEHWFKTGLETVHTAQWPSYKNADYINFKCWYQLENLCKRYTSPKDVLTPMERDRLTVEKFLSVQQLADNPPPVNTRCFKVLQVARAYIKRVLGPFSMDELCSNVAFGTRANKGVPYSQSYIENKMYGLSGSPDHAKWFEKTYLPTDDLLRQDLSSRKTPLSIGLVDTLELVCVPKKHNSSRTIMPNSVLGTFYTNGLMCMIARRLAENGYNINYLQKKHGVYAQYGSRTGKLSTGDLSSASDLPGFALMCRLLPRDWLNALRFGRIGKFSYNGRSYKLTSFMAMGINYTFPLETLIFLALLKAIGQLTDTKGTISVYGDDLIYPTSMAPFVKVVFEEIGLKFNKEKSFSTGFFRESCGQDFIYGRPVRPFQPEVQGGVVARLPYLALLYKCFNGLCNRWKQSEIPTVLHFLYREILRISYVHIVPHDFPDTAGVKTEFAKAIHFPWWIPTTPVWYNPERCQFGFMYLAQKRQRRVVTELFPYYWNSMRLASRGSAVEFFQNFTDLSDRVELTWIQSRRRVRTRSGWTSQLLPTVPDKSKGVTYTSNEGFTSMWTCSY